MKKQKREPRYVSQLTVHVPSAEALIDMLRYDRCCPASEDESRKIWRLINDLCVDGVNSATPSDHIIRLHRFAAAETPATDGRWRSFGCRVLDERSTEAVQLNDEELLNLAKAMK